MLPDFQHVETDQVWCINVNTIEGKIISEQESAYFDKYYKAK